MATVTDWIIGDLARVGEKLIDFAADPFHTVPEKAELLEGICQSIRNFEHKHEVTVT